MGCIQPTLMGDNAMEKVKIKEDSECWEIITARGEAIRESWAIRKN